MEKTVSATGKYPEEAWSGLRFGLVIFHILFSCDVWCFRSSYSPVTFSSWRPPTLRRSVFSSAGSFSEAPDLKVTSTLVKVLMGTLIFATVLWTLTGGRWRRADKAVVRPAMVTPCKHRGVTRHARHRVDLFDMFFTVLARMQRLHNYFIISAMQMQSYIHFSSGCNQRLR